MARKYVENDDDVQDQVSRSARRAHDAMRDERGGMRGGYPGFEEGHHPMVGRDDHAGFPSEVVMKKYPKGSQLTKDEKIDDTMSEIDDACERGEGKRRKYLSNQH